MSNIEVSKLMVYPVKSCGGIAVAETGFTELGMRYDREWMLVGSNRQFISQRVKPELARVATVIDAEALHIEAPGTGQLTVPLDRSELDNSNEIDVTVFKKPGTGIDQGNEAADLFSTYLDKPVRLLRIQQPRQVNPRYTSAGATGQVGFADGFPMLLASMQSLEQLNSELDAPVSIDNFRANVVITGEACEPYDEDYYREIGIGGLRTFVQRACARCPIPNIDQRTGILPKQRLVTEALQRTRAGYEPATGDKGVYFGQNVSHVYVPDATVMVGDTVRILERSARRNIVLNPTAN